MTNFQLKKRKHSSHKGENGRIIALLGSIDYVGAAVLACTAAYRTGADYLKVAAPEKVALVINYYSPDIVTIKLKGSYLTIDHYEKIESELSKSDVLLIGNGVGKKQSTKKLCQKVFESPIMKVIDADAISFIDLKVVQNAIITPHEKEFKTLLENNNLTEKDLQEHLGNNVILLKGEVDKIITENEIIENRTGNAGMTVAGTGDILAGICAGLLSAQKDLTKSATAAAQINGKIGDMLFEEFSNGFLASEFLDLIPKEVEKLG